MEDISFLCYIQEEILMKAEIICIGTELLVGDIVNTNSQYISKKLTDIGIDLYYQTTVGDNFERVKECLEIAFNRADLVITTGGLGPTIDDITKEVAADYFNENLEVVQKYYDEVVERYSNRGFDIAKGAKKEASILKNSELLENEVGLAPGFFYEKENKKIIVLPGPPKEMTWMMDNQAIPLPVNIFDTGWYTGSVKPGQPGASIIIGHASGMTLGGIFNKLESLNVGDTVSVERGNGQMLRYQVVKKQIIKLSDVDMNSFMRPADGVSEGLNLMTCAGEWIKNSQTRDHRAMIFTKRI